MKLNVNTQIGLPILLENLQRLAGHENKSNPVIGSRLETVCLLLEHLTNDKMWAVILRDGAAAPPEQPTMRP